MVVRWLLIIMSLECITRLSELSGCSKDTVKKRCKDLASTKGNRGAVLFESKEALRAILQVDINDGEVLDLTQERARLARSQTQKTITENAIKKRELLDFDEVAELIMKMAGIVASQQDAAAGRIANEIIAITDPAEARKILFREFRSIRSQIAKAVKKYAKVF